MTDSICFAAAGEIAALIRSRDISCVEVVQAHLQQIERVNGRLNAIATLDSEGAMAAAHASDARIAAGENVGALHGVPFTIKDSFDTAGLVSTGGTEGRRGHIPVRDARIVARLRAAGAILLGKTITPELTMGGGEGNLIHGRTCNPYDNERSPSGSSSGAAAIVAAGGAAFDIGSDTGGSIREPAHFCGIAGLKPTAGCVPLTGHIIPSAFGALGFLTQPGPLARTSDDLWLLLSVIAGPDNIDPRVVPVSLIDPQKVDMAGLRVAVFTDNGLIAAEPDVADAVQAAGHALEQQGAIVQQAVPEAIAEWHDLYTRLRHGDGGSSIERRLKDLGTSQASPILAQSIEEAKPGVSGAQLAEILEDVEYFQAAMLEFMSGFDVLVCPAAKSAALTFEEERAVRDFVHWSFLTPFNLTGWPCAVVPVSMTSDGLPVGVQIAAPSWQEHVVLQTATTIEQAFGGYRPPDLSACDQKDEVE